jgi:chloride channel protein, CIC family
VTSSESSSSVPLARNPIALLRTRSYVMLLVLGALVGIPVAAVAYFLLKFVDVAQQYVFVSLPDDLGWDPAPTWWPILPLMVSGLVVALTIEHLHGTAGHEPAEGFKSTGPVDPVDLPGIVLASLATLCLGAVLGPEAPLIAIGSGLGVLAVHLVKKDAPATALVVIGTAGSFAAVSTLFGSPLAGAFLLMEAAGIGGPLLGVVLTPGLLAAGVGSLIFVGLDNWTGFGTFSLSVGPIPLAGSPTVAETCWAVGIGIIAAVLGTAIKRGALALRPVIARRRVLLTPLVGIAVALLAIGFAQATDKAYSYVLFDGQSALAPLLQNAADWSVGAVVLLTACKGTAYALSLSSFRGGPVFPGMFIGAALGIALSHLPGLSMIAGVGMGIGAMTVAMLGLPMVSVLLASLLLSSDGLTLMPLIIVAVVVSYVASARLTPMSATESAADTSSTPSPA